MLPVRSTVWRDYLNPHTGTIESYYARLTKVEDLMIVFFNQEEPLYPEMTFFRAAYWLVLTSAEDEATHFWSWIFRWDWTVLPHVGVLRLTSKQYPGHLLEELQNWATLARKIPTVSQIEVTFLEEVVNRSSSPLRGLIETAWPGLRCITIKDRLGLIEVPEEVYLDARAPANEDPPPHGGPLE
jgi:hypothetical protein